MIVVQQNAELFTLTHGAIVRQLLADVDYDVSTANSELHRMGESIGARLADDFLAKLSAASTRCDSFGDSVAVVAEAVKAYLGVSADAVQIGQASEYEIRFNEDNPMAEWVELPDSLAGLEYTAMLAGAIKGGLQAVGLRVSVWSSKQASSISRERETFRVSLLSDKE